MLTLKDICVVDWGNTSLTKKSYEKNGAYLAVSATGADGKISHYEHEADVCVLSAIGAQCGKMFFPQQRFTAIKNTITLTPNRDLVDSKYLYYLFSHIELPKRGAAQPFISKGDIEKFELPYLPPLAEQQRIVAKLDAAFAEIDSAIKRVEAKQVNAERLKSSLLDVLLKGGDALWKTVKLGDVTKPVGGSGFPKKYQGITEGEVPFFKVSDMNLLENETHMLAANNYVSREMLRAMKAKAYPAGTVIFPKIGGAISTNKKRILVTEAAFDNNVMGLVPNKEISSEYLYKIFLNLDLYELSNKAALPSITASTVKELDVFLPKLEEQQRIVAKLDAAFTEIDTVFATTRLAKGNYIALKSAILAQELNPSEAA